MDARFQSLRRVHALRFRQILLSHGARDAAEVDRVFSELVDRYEEAHRGHHNNIHVCEFHALLDLHSALRGDADAAFVAVEFHDAIYRVPSDANEAESRKFLEDGLSGLGVSTELIMAAGRLIDITAPGVTCCSPDEMLFRDCDYWVLGSRPARYCEYMFGIEREYAAKLHWPLYCAGRSEFLESLLHAGRVFLTPEFQLSYGAQAQANVAWELEFLKQVRR